MQWIPFFTKALQLILPAHALPKILETSRFSSYAYPMPCSHSKSHYTAPSPPSKSGFSSKKARQLTWEGIAVCTLCNTLTIQKKKPKKQTKKPKTKNKNPKKHHAVIARKMRGKGEVHLVSTVACYKTETAQCCALKVSRSQV